MSFVEIPGLDAFLSGFSETATAYIDECLKESVIKQVALVTQTAKELCPIGDGEIQKSHIDKYGFHSGLLRDSIVGVVNSSGKSGVVMVPEAAMTDPYYGHMVHFGTTKMVGRPFLYQASERHSSEFQDNIAAKIKEQAPEAI